MIQAPPEATQICCPRCKVPGWVVRNGNAGERDHRSAWLVSDSYYLRIANAYRMARPQIVCAGCGKVISS